MTPELLQADSRTESSAKPSKWGDEERRRRAEELGREIADWSAELNRRLA